VQGVQLGHGAFLTAGALLARNLADSGRWPAPDVAHSSVISQEQSK
jgi:hypothetical protein